MYLNYACTCLVFDDLEKLHVGDRREVMHADHVLGPFGALGDIADRDGRGVGGEDAVLWDVLFDLRDDLVLEAEGGWGGGRVVKG